MHWLGIVEKIRDGRLHPQVVSYDSQDVESASAEFDVVFGYRILTSFHPTKTRGDSTPISSYIINNAYLCIRKPLSP